MNETYNLGSKILSIYHRHFLRALHEKVNQKKRKGSGSSVKSNPQDPQFVYVPQNDQPSTIDFPEISLDTEDENEYGLN